MAEEGKGENKKKKDPLARIEEKLDLVNNSIVDIRTSVSGLEDRLNTIEQSVNNVADLVKREVTREVTRSLRGVRDDVSLLERKMNEMQVRMNAVESQKKQADMDLRTVILRNFTTENEERLYEEVSDLFSETLEVFVTIDAVDRYKAFEDRIGMVKVVLGSEEDKVDILKAKRKLMDIP